MVSNPLILPVHSNRISKGAVQAELVDGQFSIDVLYADGEEPLAAVVSRSNDDIFETLEDLEAESYNNLPVDAGGEPGQSEGEG